MPAVLAGVWLRQVVCTRRRSFGVSGFPWAVRPCLAIAFWVTVIHCSHSCGFCGPRSACRRSSPQSGQRPSCVLSRRRLVLSTSLEHDLRAQFGYESIFSGFGHFYLKSKQTNRWVGIAGNGRLYPSSTVLSDAATFAQLSYVSPWSSLI